MKLRSNEDIAKRVENAKREAQKMVKTLAMRKFLQENRCWENPPIPTFKEEHIRENHKEDEVDSEALTDVEVIPQLLEQIYTAQEANDI